MSLGFFLVYMVPMTVYGFRTSVFKSNSSLKHVVLTIDIIGILVLILADQEVIEYESTVYGGFYGILFYYFMKTSINTIRGKYKEAL